MSGNSYYTLEYLVGVDKDLAKISPTNRVHIRNGIEEKLAFDPVGFGKPLRYSLSGCRRLRVGDYRVVYRIDQLHHRVFIITIQHRSKIYD